MLSKGYDTIVKSLPEKFKSERKIVCIQGLGFVGSAMALAVASTKDTEKQPLYNVIGIEVPSEDGEHKVQSFNTGKFPFENSDRNLEKVQDEVYKNGNLWATTDSDYFKYADIVIVDINLDIAYDEEKKPLLELSQFEKAIDTIGKNIKQGALIIIETTVPPGTCENIVYPIIKKEFRNRDLPEEKIFIAHSYERVMPGNNYFDSIINYWRVYSGINTESADRCQYFLETVICTEKYPLTRLEGTTSTEMAKILENSYRAVNIAFMEEWGRFAEAVKVDLFEIIDAIRMRPTHSNMRQPGFGVGGYCLTKDPFFAPLAAKDIFGLEDMDFPYSTSAVQTNNKMPIVSLDKIEQLLGGDLRGKKILVLGVSYRQDIGDTRYSPTEIFVREALKRGAEVVCQDPLVSVWKEMGISVLREIPVFKGFSAIVFAVQHKQYKEIELENMEMDTGTLIFDANCVLDKWQRDKVKKINYIKFASIGR